MSYNNIDSGTVDLSIIGETYVESVSVSELVRRRMDPNDSWRLALVQRHSVWDEVRMARLLDSLLAGYPIGSILVCRLKQNTKVLEEKGSTRIAVEAPAGSWQLLDGQQRINALVSIFSDFGRFGRFFLDMMEDRETDDIVTRRRAKRESTRYIVWREQDENGVIDSLKEKRWRYIDLSRWFRWANGKKTDYLVDTIQALDRNPQSYLQILNDIDPAFADELESGAISIAVKRLQMLLRIWAVPSIPVQYLTLDTPSDVLQVFSRINLEGVRLDGEDVFFAAVKTLWPDAEENLDRVAKSTFLINRITALRLLARLASQATGQGDLQPLRVDRLNGSRGRKIIDTMCLLAQDGSEVLGRIGLLGNVLTTESNLGYGLHEISSMLFDHVFGWAVVNPRATDRTYLISQLKTIETYLLGATSFRYPAVFIDTFARIGFEQSLAAGIRSDPFPLDQIISKCGNEWPGLRRGRRSVRAVASDADRLALADANAGIFLSIAHHLLFELPWREASSERRELREVEWDHIYPQAQAKAMRVRDKQSGRFNNHPDRSLVWSSGNLWALDRPLNNRASDLMPSKKFELLKQLPNSEEKLPSCWPTPEASFLTDDERQRLLEAERLILSQQVNEGMAIFREFVRGRGLRLYDEVLKSYPSFELFAPGNIKDIETYERALEKNIRSAMELGEIDHVPEFSEETISGFSGFEAVFSQAKCCGVEKQLMEVISVARKIGLYARPYKVCVMFTPLSNRTRMLFTLWPQNTNGGSFNIFRSSEAIVEFFPHINKEKALILGQDGIGSLQLVDIAKFLEHLEQLFTINDSSVPSTAT